MDSVAARIAWALQVIKTDQAKGISDVALAKSLGTDKNTLARYRQKKGLIKSEVIEKLIDVYKFDPHWIFTGQYEPFPGAHQKYPEVCGPIIVPGRHANNADTYYSMDYTKKGCDAVRIDRENDRIADTYNTTTKQAADQRLTGVHEFKVSDALTMTAEVLESGTSYATALYLNIQHFSRAVKAESQISQVIERNNEQARKIAALESENAQVKIQLANLQSAVKKLQERNGKTADNKGENNDNVAKEAAQ